MAISVKKVQKWAEKKKVSKLLKALSVNDVEIRIAAIEALGKTKDENAMNTLITLFKDPNALIRANAAEALGNIGNGRTLEFVRQLWNTDSDENVREKAKKAINDIKENMAKLEKP